MTFIYKYFLNRRAQRIFRILTPFLVTPFFALAQPTTCDELIALIDRIGLTMQAFVGSVAVIMFLYASYLYLTAGDDAQKIKKAHSTIAYTVVGIVAALIGIFGVEIVESFVGDTLFPGCATP